MKFVAISLVVVLFVAAEVSAGTLTINHALEQKQIQLEVDMADTVLSLKEKIQQVEGAPVGEQALIRVNDILENHRTLASYHISSGESLLLLVLHPSADHQAEQAIETDDYEGSDY